MQALMTQLHLFLHPGPIFLTLITAVTLFLVLKSKFKLHYHSNEKNHRRINHCSFLKKATFFPTPYLANGMLQAVFGKYSTHSDTNLEFSKEILTNPCGGKVGIHWATQKVETERAKQNAKKAVIIMLPGLTASSQEPYIRNISSEALENGYKVAIYHSRGNRIEMIFPNEGHMDLVLDFKHTVDYVKKTLPDHMILAVGHSYGANILVSYLGRFKDENPIKAAVSVANPFNFHKAKEGVEGTMFDGFLVQVMKGWARRNEDALLKAPKHLELLFDKAMSCKSLTEFDEYITRKMLGFSSLDDYYTNFSCQKYIKDVNIPLFCLNSKDDPVLSNTSIPIEELKKNEHIILAITNNGGHVGWFEGFFKPKRWFPKPTLEFLNHCFEEITQKIKSD